MSEEMKVYLVETVDDLLESWFPTSVYLHRESAENCAEALRCDDGYIRQFARVVEMKVADTEACQTDADGLDSGHVRNSSAYEAGYRDGSVHYELDHCPACKNVADLQEALEENAKLRELVRDYERCTMHADCSMCEYDGKLSTHCPLSPCFPDADELCELGIEVG